MGQEAVVDGGRPSRTLEVRETDHTAGASAGAVQPVGVLLQPSLTSPSSHEDLTTLSTSEEWDQGTLSSISETLLTKLLMHVPSATLPKGKSDFLSQFIRGKASQTTGMDSSGYTVRAKDRRFLSDVSLTGKHAAVPGGLGTVRSVLPFATSTKEESERRCTDISFWQTFRAMSSYSGNEPSPQRLQRDVLFSLTYHADYFLSPRSEKISRRRSWHNTLVTDDTESTIRKPLYEPGRKSVFSLTTPLPNPFTCRAMMSPRALGCEDTTILPAEGSGRRRRSVPNTSTVWPLVPGLAEDQTAVTLQVASNTPATSVEEDLSSREVTTWPDAPQSSSSLALENTSVLDNDTALSCGRGGNWSCKDRCGLPPSFPCSCDALCHLTGHCCEDFQSECSLPIPPAVSVFDRRRLRCRHGYVMVTKCPKAWAGSEVAEACKNRKPKAVDDLSPVSDTATGLVFANVHCARCNGVTDVEGWEVSADCTRVGPKFADLLKECKFSFRVPANYSAQRCVYGAVSNLYYRSCPRIADPVLVEKCHKFHSYVTTSEKRNKKIVRVWKNVYCLQCMWSSFPDAECLESLDMTWSLSKFQGGHFMLLMKWNVDGEAKFEVEREMPDAPPKLYEMNCNATGQCFATTCPNGSVLFRGRACWPAQFRALVFLPLVTGLMNDEVNSALIIGLTLDPELNQICPVDQRTFLSDSKSLTATIMCVTSEVNEMGDERFSCLLTATVRKAYESLHEDLKPFVKPSEISIEWGTNRITNIYSCEYVPSTTRAVSDVPRVESLFLTVERYVSLTGCSLSVLALSLRVALQFCVPYFQSVPSKLQLALALSLLLAYVGFLAGAEVPEGTWGCWAVAVLTHAAFVASFLWMNVFAFHLWRSLSKMRSVTMSRDARGTLMRAAAFCSLCTLLLIGTAVAFDLALPDHVVSPRYARPGCWLNNGWGLVTFFVVPSSFICTVNAIFAILTLRLVSQQRMGNWDHVASNPMVDVRLAIRLVILTGVTWLVGVVAGLAQVSALWMIFTVLNSLLGFAIGLNLILNRRNIRFYLQKLSDNGLRSDVTQSSNVT